MTSWPGNNSTFKRIKAREDELRKLYALARDDPERPDLEDPVHNLIKLSPGDFDQIRNRMSTILFDRMLHSDAESTQNLFRFVRCCLPKEFRKPMANEDQVIIDQPVLNVLRFLPPELKRHICLAGGAPLEILLYGKVKFADDYDLFIVGTDNPLEIADKLIKQFRKNGFRLHYGVRNKHAVSMILRNREHIPFENKVQIILRSYVSPSEVLTGFDLDASGICLWNDDYYITPRARYSLENMVQYVDLDRLSPSYEYRLAKYSKRGFMVHVPVEIDYAKFYPILLRYSNLPKNIQKEFKLSGLGKLLILEAKMTGDQPIDSLAVSDYEFKGKLRFNGKKEIQYFRKGSAINDKNIVAYLTFDDGLLLDISEVEGLEEDYDFPVKAEFLTENPGRQGFTGSFQPLETSWEEWAKPEMTRV